MVWTFRSKVLVPEEPENTWTFSIRSFAHLLSSPIDKPYIAVLGGLGRAAMAKGKRLPVNLMRSFSKSMRIGPLSPFSLKRPSPPALLVQKLVFDIH
ncbi:hypothetical protein D9757_008128 [Collybiopsis confluens]|uniref:Uncharacterized protein n=1 Tax=Collybiopsis confluens TaxID=2823264 RepID=A0A8H5HDV3_9AGAR|nr:hypothetical protein D9757_008128 [Collybiopsis confluens]